MELNGTEHNATNYLDRQRLSVLWVMESNPFIYKETNNSKMRYVYTQVKVGPQILYTPNTKANYNHSLVYLDK